MSLSYAVDTLNTLQARRSQQQHRNIHRSCQHQRDRDIPSGCSQQRGDPFWPVVGPVAITHQGRVHVYRVRHDCSAQHRRGEHDGFSTFKPGH